MSLIKLLLGIIMLTMGRRLFWLFIGSASFVLGFDIAERILPNLPHDITLIIAVIAGLVSALVAVTFHKVAIYVGGFWPGGYLLIQVLTEFGIHIRHHWLPFIAGGIIGAILINLAFNLALIVLSSLFGAILIGQALHLSAGRTSIPFFLLCALEIAMQYGLIKLKPLSPKG
jgi:hypothetical protein